MSAPKRPIRVVSSIDATRLVPRLVDIHEVDEQLEKTLELPDPYESTRQVARAWRRLWDEQERARSKGLQFPERAGGVR